MLGINWWNLLIASLLIINQHWWSWKKRQSQWSSPNSTLQMIQRLTRNKAAVSAVFDNTHHKHNLVLLNESEWEKLRIMETLLEPCLTQQNSWVEKGTFLVQLCYQRCAIYFVPWLCPMMTLLMWFGSRRLLLRIFNNVRKIAIYRG